MHRRFSGFSLLEVLVALLIGALLTTALVSVFANAARLYTQLEARSQVVENGRFSVDLLAQDLRQAGSWGCLGNDFSSVANRLQNTSGFSLPHIGTGVRVFHPDVAGWSALPAAVRSAAVADQSALLVSGVRDTGVRVRGVDQDATELSGLERVWDGFLAGVETGDMVLAVNSTCERGELFQVSSVQRNAGDQIVLGYAEDTGVFPGNLAFDLLAGLGITTGQNDLNQDRGIQLYRIFSHLYFIGSGVDGVAADQRALMRWDLRSGSIRTLVPDIRGMYFYLGTGVAEHLDGYVYELDPLVTPIASWTTEDWSKVRAVRFALLATSSPVASEADRVRQLVFRPGQAAVSLTGRHGAVYTTTTALRARIRN